MSTNESGKKDDSGDSSNNVLTSTTTSTSSSSSKPPPAKLQLPDIQQFDLKSTIQAGVRQTNAFLATLESQKIQTTNMVSSRLNPLVNQLKYGMEQGMKYYEMRRYYGPQIVAGTASAVGLLVASRRGKIPGVVMGGLSGLGAYGVVYGQDGIGK
jgi:hypothetical protein